ncbi:MAG: hypothetical protein DHS20C01_12210 [marine bacterium B5-7]|nr:MAG: hypothetical protein DHS20C01_12210 [marine bacterium B5-7]
MPEVYSRIFNRRFSTGFTEQFVDIDVRLTGEIAQFDYNPFLDKRALSDLATYQDDKPLIPVLGIAKIAWKDDDSQAAWRATHVNGSERRRKRFRDVERYVEKLRSGIRPPFAHVYLHPSVTGLDGLMVIDGSRRMISFLIAGLNEMPVLIFRRN